MNNKLFIDITKDEILLLNNISQNEYAIYYLYTKIDKQIVYIFIISNLNRLYIDPNYIGVNNITKDGVIIKNKQNVIIYDHTSSHISFTDSLTEIYNPLKVNAIYSNIKKNHLKVYEQENIIRHSLFKKGIKISNLLLTEYYRVNLNIFCILIKYLWRYMYNQIVENIPIYQLDDEEASCNVSKKSFEKFVFMNSLLIFLSELNKSDITTRGVVSILKNIYDTDINVEVLSNFHKFQNESKNPSSQLYYKIKENESYILDIYNQHILNNIDIKYNTFLTIISRISCIYKKIYDKFIKYQTCKARNIDWNEIQKDIFTKLSNFNLNQLTDTEKELQSYLYNMKINTKYKNKLSHNLIIFLKYLHNRYSDIELEALNQKILDDDKLFLINLYDLMLSIHNFNMLIPVKISFTSKDKNIYSMHIKMQNHIILTTNISVDITNPELKNLQLEYLFLNDTSLMFESEFDDHGCTFDIYGSIC